VEALTPSALPSARKSEQLRFVAFANQSPPNLSKAPWLYVQYQLLENAPRYFSKNKIDTRTRDEEGHKVYVMVAGTFVLESFFTPGVLDS